MIRIENDDEFESFHDDPEALPRINTLRKRFAGAMALIVLVVGGSFFIQTTLASNITINSASPVQFGQGLAKALACTGSSNVTVIPIGSFSNSSGAGSFKFSGITVSGIPSGCYGSDFTINAYSDTSSVALALFASSTKNLVVYDNAGTFELGIGGNGATISSGSGTFTVTFTVPVATSSSVLKIAIQSGVHTVVTCALGGSCSVGDTGPGGGTIYFYYAAGFNCGADYTSTGSPTGTLCHYLETAPNTWPDSGTDPSLAWTVSGAPRTSDVAGITNDATRYLNIASVGLGYKNSNLITTQSTACTTPLVIASCTYAAGAARAYRGGSLDDWYLPTYAELNLACQWSNGLTIDVTASCTGGSRANGNFVGDRYYWSSSEGNASNAWYLAFGDGGAGSNAKSSSVAVRPIRSF
ncbi:MAG: DUF1566 domain-containing protein [Actinobacteria bacterium]|nr:DUF1566 domain-containing protein [Actinomycetota bacterium]